MNYYQLVLIGCVIFCGGLYCASQNFQSEQPDLNRPMDKNCSPQDVQVKQFVARSCCQEKSRFVWNGVHCMEINIPICYCMICQGTDCGKLFESLEDCRRTYSGCMKN